MIHDTTYCPQQLFIIFEDDTPDEKIKETGELLEDIAGHGMLSRYDGRYRDFNLPSGAYVFSCLYPEGDDPYLLSRIISGGCVREVHTFEDLVTSNLSRREG